MEASRSTLIKSLLAREGPKTINQLFTSVLKTFPSEFQGVSRHKFKRIYLRNLKEFKQVAVKPERDPDALAKLRLDPESRITATDKIAWMVQLADPLMNKYLSGEVDLTKNHNTILKTIDMERAKSKDFWEGKSNTPHDWRAVLEAAGQKTSI
ncbi:hypothetical protein BX661DRAFT_168168 [Kickxella alabastrina]|uniref:uncharacterized protein n=1 Tax=Kickxella alabastrina TaxID=61397 RepID=UPI00221FAE13|nr:uncharacterized protein BX661DRAFT_168168 [Kickxella alabastrina]KAI7834986.1 hypothetical protein BX661DRAFT_168168 [Kickxella alabastrina]KAJ1946562.1 hypothetical protein GGF37_001094 [Kickxella alabastrina]